MKFSIIITFILCCNPLAASATNALCEIDSIAPPFSHQAATYLSFYKKNNIGRLPYRRTPSTSNILPAVWIEGTQLMLHGVVTIDNLYYEVLDADDCPVLSGYVCVRKDAELSISLASLPSDSYTLQLTLGSDTYAADFEL